MKRNAVVRIVCYSVLLVVLLGVLLAGLGIGQLHFDISLGSGGEPINGEVAVDASKIQNLEIEWVDGSIDICIATDGSSDIRIREEGADDESHRATWKIRGKTLVIEYSQPSIQIGFVSMPDKDLTVEIPADWVCGSLDIESVSASIDVTLLEASRIDVENVSGECRFSGCKAGEVDISTVSGNVEYMGDVQELECESVSADCKIIPDNAPQVLKLESVSGNLIVGIMEDVGFTTRLDSVSGHIYSDFSTDSFGGNQTYGDGGCRIEADTVSGDIEIKRMEIRLTGE